MFVLVGLICFALFVLVILVEGEAAKSPGFNSRVELILWLVLLQHLKLDGDVVARVVGRLLVFVR